MKDHQGDVQLAQRLLMDSHELYQVLGRGWERRADVLGDEALVWFTAGEPPQLLLGVGPADLVVARPRGIWDGPASLRFEPVDQQGFDLTDVQVRPEVLGEAAAAIAARRRRTFRWCLTCRRVQPPEWFERSAERCMHCAEVVDGVVH